MGTMTAKFICFAYNGQFASHRRFRVLGWLAARFECDGDVGFPRGGECGGVPPEGGEGGGATRRPILRRGEETSTYYYFITWAAFRWR